jgi:hypothetical protein
VAETEPITVPRVEDITRHLDDLRTRSYEGVSDRDGRNQVFARAVELLGPVVTAVLDEADAVFLDGEGTVETHPVADDGDGGLEASWTLTWPAQRSAANKRAPGGVGPVTVRAWFKNGFNHGHLAGSSAGYWPLQVTGEADAARQEPIVRAITEVELHERIYEAGWQVVPSYAKRYPTG